MEVETDVIVALQKKTVSFCMLNMCMLLGLNGQDIAVNVGSYLSKNVI